MPEGADAPPAYRPASIPLPGPALPAIQPCNRLLITRKDSIKGQYLIDPELDIPEALLAPLKEGQERKNLHIASDDDIKVEIWIAGRATRGPDAAPPGKSRITTIDLKGEDVRARICVVDESPFVLNIIADKGDVSLEIPRSFTGPLTMEFDRRGGGATFSSALQPRVATFYDVDELRKCFVGDFSSSGFGQGEWTGSSINIKAREKVRMRYIDEGLSAPMSNSPYEAQSSASSSSSRGWWFFGGGGRGGTPTSPGPPGRGPWGRPPFPSGVSAMPPMPPMPPVPPMPPMPPMPSMSPMPPMPHAPFSPSRMSSFETQENQWTEEPGTMGAN